MSTIYKTKHKCRVCNDYIKIKYHNATHNYYMCDKCNLIYAYDREKERFTAAYEPRKIVKF